MSASRGRVAAEVAVVGGIVLVLAGLVLPAVMKARDTAARSRCSNNLKLLGLSLHNYADTLPVSRDGRSEPAFPAGTIAAPGRPPERRLSWVVGLVPFLESSNVYQQFDLTAPADAPVNRTAGDNRFVYFVCSASPDVDGDNRPTAPVLYYVGFAGIGPDAASLPTGDPRAGVFGYDRRTCFAGVADGLSNTVALIEISRDPGRWAVGGPGTIRGLDAAEAPYVGPGRPFGELHVIERVPFGVGRCAAPVGMADGSVRLLNGRTPTAIVEALATVAGGDAVPVDW